MIEEYLGQFYYKCDMCGDMRYNDKYKWVGTITNNELKVCTNCAKREGGTKWPERSRQLKKLKQK